MAFFRSKKKRFSLERLKELWGTLCKNPIVTDRNKTLIIETLREVAELIIWGDQNDPTLFDFFLEKNMFAHFLRIMSQRADASIHIQLLQTLSILMENISAMHSIYYLLSNDRVNEIITYHFDFSDEELLAYYISFLKTLSLKLDASTVQFFFNQNTQQFPLYTEAVKFFNNPEAMVRVGVRTLTLAVFKVDEPSVRAFIVSGRAAPYFNNLVWFIHSRCLELESLRTKLLADIRSGPLGHKFRDCVDELTDLLYYIQDIYQLNIAQLSSVLSANLLEKLFVASFIASLAGLEGGDLSPLTALYILGQVFFILKEPSIVTKLGWLLVGGEHRKTLLKCLGQPATQLGACFLMYSIMKNSSMDTRLLEKAQLLPYSIDRQHALLAEVLGEPAAEKKVDTVVVDVANNKEGEAASSDGVVQDRVVKDSGSKDKQEAHDDAGASVVKTEGDAVAEREELLGSLLGLIGNCDNLAALQCAVLVLKPLVSNVSAPLDQSHLDSLRAAYTRSIVPLREMMQTDSSSNVIDRFEKGIDSYRQLVWTKLAGNPMVLYGLQEQPCDPIHRFLVLHDLWQCAERRSVHGGGGEDIPLQPHTVPIEVVGSQVVVTEASGNAVHYRLEDGARILSVYSTHVNYVEVLPGDDEDLAPRRLSVGVSSPLSTGSAAAVSSSSAANSNNNSNNSVVGSPGGSTTGSAVATPTVIPTSPGAIPASVRAKVLFSWPLQHLAVTFLQIGGEESESMPSTQLVLRGATAGVTVRFDTPQAASEAKQALVSRRNAIIDSKLLQLKGILGC